MFPIKLPFIILHSFFKQFLQDNYILLLVFILFQLDRLLHSKHSHHHSHNRAHNITLIPDFNKILIHFLTNIHSTTQVNTLVIQLNPLVHLVRLLISIQLQVNLYRISISVFTILNQVTLAYALIS